MSNNIINCLKDYNKINSITLRGTVTRTLLASLMASDGLLNNNLASLLPSMLISPIGSLLLDISMNAVAINNIGFKHLYSSGFGNFKFYQLILIFLLVILITIMTGIIFGAVHGAYKKLTLPTVEMKKRSQRDGMYTSAIIASICAIALPIAYSKKDVATLIAIAIGTSLLPPVANIGLTIGTYHTQPEAYKEYPINKSIKYGLLIFILNAAAISVGASLYFNKHCTSSNYKKSINTQPDFI